MFRYELNIDTFSPALVGIASELDDLSPVMRQIGRQMIESTKQRFPRGEAPDGTKWAPKSPATLAAYGARKSNRIDTRPLFGPTGLLSQQIFYDATRDGVEWGSNRVQAAVMQWGAAKGAFGTTARGAPIPWGTIPARPFIGVSQDDETQIVQILTEWLQWLSQRGA